MDRIQLTATRQEIPGAFRAELLRAALLGSLLLSPLLAGCADMASGDAEVQVQITDAPSDMLASAEVWISRVYLQGGSDTTSESSGGRVDLFVASATKPAKHYDLLTLRDGLVADLTDAIDVEPGTYGQLRLVVDSAKVTLKPGTTFEDGTQTAVLKIPGGSTSGIKVKLDRAVQAGEGERTTLLVDFDVNENFLIQGGNGPRGVKGVMFKPTLKEKSRKEEER